ncbi:MAG: Fe-S cluster assembly ATPase SufC, partial [Planctomycetota bacterium]
SGKSTLTKVLLGHEDYTVSQGSISFENEDLAELAVEERAAKGIFVGFQYPIEVPGVNNAAFLRMAYNARRAAADEPELSEEQFAPILQAKMRQVRMDPLFAERDLNSGYSGGQKKRNEILQMFVMEPKLAILDETDSGLDIDALRTVAEGINAYRSPERAIILITHYQRLLDLVTPDVVHVLAGGRIIATGGPELAERLEAEGYDRLLAEA